MEAMDRRWILGGLLIAGGIGLARVLTSRPKITHHTRLMLIGSSTAQGLNPHFKQLAAEARIPYLGRGVSGSRIDQWATSQWLDTYLAQFQPTLVLVALGTNDAYMGGDVWAKQSGALQKLLKKLGTFSNKYVNDKAGLHYSAGAEIAWIGPPTLPEIYAGRRPDPAFLEALADAVPNYYDSTDLNIPRAPDQLHATAAGYAGWAGAVWNWLT
jgi:lysophospholipase L1-like esterase